MFFLLWGLGDGAMQEEHLISLFQLLVPHTTVRHLQCRTPDKKGFTIQLQKSSISSKPFLVP